MGRPSQMVRWGYLHHTNRSRDCVSDGDTYQISILGYSAQLNLHTSWEERMNSRKKIKIKIKKAKPARFPFSIHGMEENKLNLDTYLSWLSQHPCRYSFSSRWLDQETCSNRRGEWKWNRWWKRTPRGLLVQLSNPTELWPMPEWALQTQSQQLWYGRSQLRVFLRCRTRGKINRRKIC